MRDQGTAREFADRAIKLSTDHSIPLYLDAGRMVLGWTIAHQGLPGEGVALAREALQSYKAAGNQLGICSFIGFLAEALCCAGLVDDAIATVDEGLTSAPDQPVDQCYLWWLRGKLLLDRSNSEGNLKTSSTLSSQDHQAAEDSFRKAISIAERTGAKSNALRAATSLGRLLEARGRRAAAKKLVEPLFNSINEGFDTRDLTEAKELLERLR